jgi:hypothetical protein
VDAMSEFDQIMKRIEGQFDAIDKRIAEINATLREQRKELEAETRPVPLAHNDRGEAA